MSGTAQLGVVLTTVGSIDDARRLGRALVEAGLAACVQRVRIDSSYEWGGALEDAEEVLLLIKTTTDRYREIEAWLSANHPYDLPEILMLPASRASADYGDWVEAATGRKK